VSDRPPLRAERLADGREVVVHDTRDGLAWDAMMLTASTLAVAAGAGRRPALALAGGSTPRALYERLGREVDQMPWRHTTIVFGDERCVPPDHPASNYRMARETLLSHQYVRDATVHRVRGELPPDEAADDYDRALRRAIGVAGPDGAPDPRPAAALDAPLLDVVLLGVGADGHTASLFAGSAALDERARWAVAVVAPPHVPEPRARVTLTLPVLAAARLVLVLAAGADKRDAVRDALRGGTGAPSPAGRVRALGRTVWMLDEAAASAL
jgi:6-phosphogluconolactonase